jgi:hypothetical protein
MGTFKFDFRIFALGKGKTHFIKGANKTVKVQKIIHFFNNERGANIRKNHCNSIRFTFQFISFNSHRISVISHPISVNAHFIFLISLNSHRISVISHLISHLISHVISLNSLLILLSSVISPLISLNVFLTCNSIRGGY